MRISKRRFTKACRNFELTWRYLFNFAPTLAYKFERFTPSNEVMRVLTDLNRDGVAITTADKLFGTDSCFNELEESVAQLENHDMAEQIARRRAGMRDASNIGEKGFILPLLGDQPELDPQGIYARFGLQKQILQIAQAYFGMYIRLRYYNVWHTFKSDSDARESQLWHRDREDFFILKVFAYLSTVDSNSGPFTYAPGTHPKGQIKGEPKTFNEAGVKRSRDAEMVEVVPAIAWKECVGPLGTIVFADTRGYHKGGLARSHDRIIYTCMFTSDASESHEFLRRQYHTRYPADRGAAFALAPRHRAFRWGSPLTGADPLV